MGRIDNVPWEMIAGLAIIIALIAGPVSIGWLALKLYRLVFPSPSNEGESILLGGADQKDGFFKTYFIGLVICSLVLIFIYYLIKL